MIPSTIGKKAQAFAAALAVTGALLGISGGSAHAEARGIDDALLCAMERSNGRIDFYLPGEATRDEYGHIKICENGKWRSALRWGIPAPEAPRAQGGVLGR